MYGSVGPYQACRGLKDFYVDEKHSITRVVKSENHKKTVFTVTLHNLQPRVDI